MPRLANALPMTSAALSATLMTLVGSGLVHAQAAGNLELDGFRPAIDSRGYLTLNASEVLDHNVLSFGLGSLAWGRHLLAFQNGPAMYSVNNVISATLVAALGLRVGGVPFEVGASLPFTIMNGARGPDRSAIPRTRTMTFAIASTRGRRTVASSSSSGIALEADPGDAMC